MMMKTTVGRRDATHVKYRMEVVRIFVYQKKVHTFVHVKLVSNLLTMGSLAQVITKLLNYITIEKKVLTPLKNDHSSMNGVREMS